MNKCLRCFLGLSLAITFGLVCVTKLAAQSTASASGDPLVAVLVSKGILTAEEAKAISGTPTEQRDKLAELLKEKGVITTGEYSSLHSPSLVPVSMSLAAPAPTQEKPKAPAAPSVIPAIAPIRVLQLEPAKPGGLIPDIKLGSGAKLKLYGFFKSTAIYDTSNQQGNDFPLPGFLGDTGPSGSPEFHIKARSFRAGGNFEWPDISKNLAFTGRLEFDFEGNFTRVNNRNISSIRSSQPSIRLAWGRLDYKFNDKTSAFALFGQDWTPFGSSTLPNLLETTGLGIGFGTLYERLPQFRVGVGHNFGKVMLQPEFAIVLPAFGNLPPFIGTQTVDTTAAPSATAPVTTGPGNLGDQLGYGERQGVDSQRPEIQARLVTQWQLDHAKGVPPAQFIISAMQGSRRAIVTAAGVPTAFKTAFPTGAEVDSDRHGITGEIQLPTRYATLTAKYYNGTDLRFYFAGQIFSEFNDTIGLTSTATAPSIDGSSTVVFGLRNGVRVVAPQLPVRSQGGFVNLGLPLSRIFGANPEGRGAGWSMYLHYGYDSAFARDVRRFGPNNRNASDLSATTFYYKVNPYVTFGYELSYYRTRAIGKPLFRGVGASEMHDLRSEFGPIITF